MTEQLTPLFFFSSVQSLSRVQLFATPLFAQQASLSIISSWSLLKLLYIESVRPSNYLILCNSLLLPPSVFPSIRVFSNESALCIRCSKYWSFSFSISPSNEHPGLFYFTQLRRASIHSIEGFLFFLHPKLPSGALSVDNIVTANRFRISFGGG